MLIRATPRGTSNLAVFLQRASDIEVGIAPRNTDEQGADRWFKSQTPAPPRQRVAAPKVAVEPRSRLADAALAAVAVCTGFMAAVIVAGLITSAVGVGMAWSHQTGMADALQVPSIDGPHASVRF